jgi:hypothetical protein
MATDTPPPRRRQRDARARRALVLLVALALGSQAALSGWLERDPRLRDPEYGRKLARLRERLREQPRRPLVLALGSSRVCMGVCPEPRNPADAPEAVPPGDAARPMLFNFGLIGSGPVMELFCLRRLLADGVRPDALLVEFWPPFLYERDDQLEERRISVNRLARADVALLSRYSEDAEGLAGRWRQARLVPWFAHRLTLLSELSPGWLPWYSRCDYTWQDLDRWGWLPAHDAPPDPESRRQRLAKHASVYGPVFARFVVSPVAEQAWRELLDRCRQERIPVTLLRLPESSEFRAWYPPAVTAASEEFLARLRGEYAPRVVDARPWSSDPDVPDGFHLSAEGAARFTARLQREAVPGAIPHAEVPR